MKIAILTRPDFRSPRVLAETLKSQLEEKEVEVKIFNEIKLLNRLVSFKESKLNFHFWLKRKCQFILKDAKLLKELKDFDTVIISECVPNSFIRSIYNVEKFKRIIKRPVGLYEVYYLGNAPTQIDLLKKNNDALLERFDFHLSVSDITEIRIPYSRDWYSIGIKADSWNLKPMPKKEIIAIVDFMHAGNEQIRESQIKALNEAGIKYISLEKSYTFSEIRNIYKQGAIYFMQSFEAFGVSLLECLCCGCQIFTPKSGWPMSWRLNEKPEVHGDGILPDCFTVYNDEKKLLQKLIKFKDDYDLIKTPEKVFNNFLAHYPDYFFGNKKEVGRLMVEITNANADSNKKSQ